MKSMNRTVLLIVLTAAPLFAHDTWIAPNRFVAHRGDTIELQMTSGMEFPKLDTAIKPDRVARAAIRLGGHLSRMDARSAEHSLAFAARLRANGVATIAVELAPKSIELTPAQVTEYFDEIGADAEVRRQWNDRPEPKRWREIYTKHAKTFVRVGRADDSWKEPSGLSLEFIPSSDPTSLRVGGTFPVRLMQNGKPLANFPVGVVHEADSHGTILKTDSDGQMNIPLPKRGRYMVRATHLRPAQRSDADWLSDFTTLTVNVQ
jgi:uncharacterized GH25 family protein